MQDERMFHNLDPKVKYDLFLKTKGQLEFYGNTVSYDKVFLVPGNFRNHHFEVRPSTEYKYEFLEKMI